MYHTKLDRILLLHFCVHFKLFWYNWGEFWNEFNYILFLTILRLVSLATTNQRGKQIKNNKNKLFFFEILYLKKTKNKEKKSKKALKIIIASRIYILREIERNINVSLTYADVWINNKCAFIQSTHSRGNKMQLLCLKDICETQNCIIIFLDLIFFI